MSESATLQFLGATGTVTGSRYLVEAGGRRVLVDCGLFQGYKNLRERNWAPFPVEPRSIDTVILTHAHLDHSGYLPRLVREGFRGEVLCTFGTRDLCGLLLPDSGHLLEEEARYAAHKGYSKHASPKPLYTQAEAEACIKRLRGIDFDRAVEVAQNFRLRFKRAGHILGAAQVRLEIEGLTLHFTGDLGRSDDVLMRPPAPLDPCDVLVCESTYGNRRHPTLSPEAELSAVVNRVLARGGTLIVPAFAVGRAQALLLHLARLRRNQAIPPVPIYLNSPMAIDATELYHRHHADHRVTREDCQAMYETAHFVRTAEESIALNGRRGPMIVISASGMATGGRVLHHLRAFAPDPRNAIVFAGYQAGGTRGAALIAGARSVRMFGEDVPVRAEVVAMQSFSAHADAEEILTWMRAVAVPPRMTFLTHGEPDASDALRARVSRELHWACKTPDYRDRVVLPPRPDDRASVDRHASEHRGSSVQPQ